MPRFMQKGTTKFYFVATIADPTNPSAAVVGAGTRLDTEIAEVNGFMFQNNPIQTPDMASTFVSNIPGEDTSENSSLVFYEEKGAANNPVLDPLDKGVTGYVVVFPYGTAGASPATGDAVDIWPVQVSSKSRAYSAGNEASKVTVAFATTGPPTLDETLVA